MDAKFRSSKIHGTRYPRSLSYASIPFVLSSRISSATMQKIPTRAYFHEASSNKSLESETEIGRKGEKGRRWKCDRNMEIISARQMWMKCICRSAFCAYGGWWTLNGTATAKCIDNMHTPTDFLFSFSIYFFFFFGNYLPITICTEFPEYRTKLSTKR